jgi:hypothetical protein
MSSLIDHVNFDLQVETRLVSIDRVLDYSYDKYNIETKNHIPFWADDAYCRSFRSLVPLLALDVVRSRPTEAAWVIEGHRPDPLWPQTGILEYADVHMRYRDGLPDVLKGVSFRTKGGERVCMNHFIHYIV